MKYEYKILNEEEQLLVTLTLQKRMKVREQRIAVNTPQVIEHVTNNFEVPKSYVLGGCLTGPHQYVDNAVDKRLSKVWVFELKKQAVKKITKQPKNNSRPASKRNA